ncbi:hypothetical protein LOK49_Contig462G00001 [Camellia lanceoleosa]|nr:hypothetical protein LOK49_Contig462G00001 [Camellia lanceoleosa]
MASDSPPTFPSPSPCSDPNPHKFAFQNPKFSSRLRRSSLHSYSLSSSPHSLSRVSDSAFCPCSPLDGPVVSVPDRQSSAGSSLRCSIRLPSLPTVLSQGKID